MKRGRPSRISDSDIRELHAEGCTNIEMAEILGTKSQTIARRLNELGLVRNPRRSRFRKQFEAYDRETGAFLAKGNITELAKELGKGERTLFAYASFLRNGYNPLPPILVREVEE